MTRIFSTTVLIVILYQIGLAQSFDKTKLDNYFNALEASNKFMGSVSVSKNGVIIYSKSIGFADIKNNAKATESSKYRIGSISKTFTTVLVFKAIEGKKLDLSQTIDKYFPAIKNAKQITIKHLLNHRSGIHSFTNDNDFLTWNTKPRTEKEMIEIITKAGSDFQPNSKAEYNNSNFILLSYILEKTFKKSYAKLLQEYIVKPIGLTNTYLGGKINPKKNECQSYSFSEDWKLEPETDISIPLGAGGVVSTPSDLTKFANALFGGKLLKAESLEIMKTIKDGYGIGLFQVPLYDKVGYGHSGNIDGFSSAFSYYSDGNIAYALTSNGTNVNNNDISIAVLSAVYGKPYEIPTFTTCNLTSEELDQYLGVYASAQIPLKITVTKGVNTLIAQGTGQPAFALKAIGKDKFNFDQTGAKFVFNPAEKTMILFQGGRQIKFAKE